MAIINQAPIPMPDYIYQQPQASIPMPDYIYQQPQSQMGAMPDYIYQQPQSQMGVETQAPPSAVPPVFMPSPMDIAAQNFYSSQEALVSQPPPPINYGQVPASGYQPGIDPPIQHVFDRVSTISPTADESGDIDEPLINPSVPAPQPVRTGNPADWSAPRQKGTGNPADWSTSPTVGFSPGGGGGGGAKGTQGQTVGNTVFMRDGGMPKQAQELAARGRHGDTTLAHVNPLELEGIARLFPDRDITRNPDTGLPEMFNFKQALPMIAGIGSMFIPGLQPWGAALISGAATAIAEEDIGKGVMAGLMSYGMGSLMSAGGSAAEKAATQVATDAATSTAAQTAAQTAAMQPIVADPSSFGTLNYGGPDYLYQGAGAGGAYPAMTGSEMAAAAAPWQTGAGGAYPAMTGSEMAAAPFAARRNPIEPKDLLDTTTGYPEFYGPASGFPPAQITGVRDASGVAPTGGVIPTPAQNAAAYMRPPMQLEPVPIETVVSPDVNAGQPGFQGINNTASPPPDGGIGDVYGDYVSDSALASEGNVKGALDTFTNRTHFDWKDATNAAGDPYKDLAAFHKAGNLEFGDISSDLMYAGMGAAGTIAPMFEEEYEYPTRDKPTYAPTRQISSSEYRVPSSPPVGYDSATEGEYSYYGNKGGIVNNLPMIYAKRGYGDEQISDVLSQVVSGQQPPPQSQMKPTPAQPPQPAQEPRQQATRLPSNIQAHLRSFMPSAYAKEGTAGGTAKALSDQKITEAIETARAFGASADVINQTKTSDLPALAARYKSMSTEGFPNITDDTGQRYLPEAIFKQDGGPAGSPVRPEEIMGAEEVATVGIMAGAPDVVQEGVREEASIMNPTDPQNAEERAVYDKAVLALEGELEPSDAQNAVDEYIEVFGAEAYRSLKNVVNRTRETGGIVKPANGESTVPNGELQGEDVIAGKIVDPMTGAETANLRVGENEYIKTGKDLAYAAAARGLPPTPENGAMVEGMEEEALRRAFG